MVRDIENDPYCRIRRESTSQALLLDTLDIELDHMVERSYSEKQLFIDLRPIAYYYCLKFAVQDRSVSYLALIHYDRFLSRNNHIPVVIHGEGFERNLELFVFTCVTYAFRAIYGEKFLFNAFMKYHNEMHPTAVRKMEDQFWEGLEGAVYTPPTAFYPLIVEPLISLLEMEDQQQMVLRYYHREILLAINEDIQITKFRPSIVSASVILVACYKLHPALYPSLSRKIYNSGYVQEVNNPDPTPSYCQSTPKSTLFSKLQECFDVLKNHVIIDFIFCSWDDYILPYPPVGNVATGKGKELLIDDGDHGHPMPYIYIPNPNHPLEFILEDHENFIDAFNLEQQQNQQGHD